jgi:hypothetical protein
MPDVADFTDNDILGFLSKWNSSLTGFYFARWPADAQFWLSAWGQILSGGDLSDTQKKFRKELFDAYATEAGKLFRMTHAGPIILTQTELTSIAPGGPYTDTTIQIPAGTVLYGVLVKVVAQIPPQAPPVQYFTVTGATSGTVFHTGANVPNVLNTTNYGSANCPYSNAIAQAIRLTPNVPPANPGGQVQVTIIHSVIL